MKIELNKIVISIYSLLKFKIPVYQSCIDMFELPFLRFGRCITLIHEYLLSFFVRIQAKMTYRMEDL